MSDSSLAPGMRDPSRRTITNSAIKDTIVFEKYGAETSGAYTLVTCTVASGGGNPLHYHGSYAEFMTAKTGTLSCVVGTQDLTFAPGESVEIPVGTQHRFFNNTDQEIVFESKVTPAHVGFEKCLYVAYGLANDGLCDEKAMPKSVVHLCLIAEMGDMRWPGVAGRLGGLFIGAVAAYGRWCGEEERLLKRYWY